MTVKDLNQVSDAFRRNNVDVQFQSSKPTTRSNGSTLVSGDRWFETVDRIWWFWDGTYWLSEQVFNARTSAQTVSATGALACLTISSSGNDLYLLDWEISGFLSGNSGVNYFDIAPQYVPGPVSEDTYSTSALSASQNISTIRTLNVHRDVSALAIVYYRINFTRAGTGTTISPVTVSLRYRLAKP